MFIIISALTIASLVGIPVAWAVADKIYEAAPDHETGIKKGQRAFYVPIGLSLLALLLLAVAAIVEVN